MRNPSLNRQVSGPESARTDHHCDRPSLRPRRAYDEPRLPNFSPPLILINAATGSSANLNLVAYFPRKHTTCQASALAPFISGILPSAGYGETDKPDGAPTVGFFSVCIDNIAISGTLAACRNAWN